MILALLCAAPLQTGLMAVLEFKNKLKQKEEADVGYLSDAVRSAALKTLPGLRVITRENMLTLLQSAGKKLEECEGECEVDTGRRIGADLIVSGELLKFGSAYKLDMKLHDTAEGRLLAGAIASGKSFDELDANLTAAVGELLAPLKAQAPAPAPAAAPVAAQPPAAKPAPAPAPGLASKRDPKSMLMFIQIPPGTAHLGCASGDEQCAPEEEKPHTAEVAGFWLGRSEVTTKSWQGCVKAGGCSAAPRKRDVEFHACNLHNKRLLHPMNCVTHAEAEAFCKWLGGRLPTSAEWEYAAKAGEDVIYPWGNAPPTGKLANFCDAKCAALLPKAKADKTQDDGFAMTAPVGSYASGTQKFGLWDMAGNVGEWTSTALGDGFEIRGGNWQVPAANLRASHRHGQKPGWHSPELGFRCAQ